MDQDEFYDLFDEATSLDSFSWEPLTISTNDGEASNSSPCLPWTSIPSPEYSLDQVQEHPRIMKTDSIIDSPRDCHPQDSVIASRGSSSRILNSSSDQTVLERIEAIFEGIADDVLHRNKDLEISLRTRTPSSGKQPSTRLAELSRPDQLTIRTVCFPGRTANEAWQFTIVIRILELVLAALRSGTVMSMRDIYYRDPALFGNQTRVNKCIDDIAFSFGVTRAKLNVAAVAKGLIAGAVKFCRRDGAVVDAADEREGMLVPTLRDLLSVQMASVKWILVIEKEATFRSIAGSALWDIIAARGIILTGKGYPDVASRALLSFLSTPSPWNGFTCPPVYAIADLDPDGLAIVSIYKNGSIAMSHENQSLCTPRLQWIGLRHEHMFLEPSGTHSSQGLLPLTSRDRRKAITMLSRCEDKDTMQALQTMLMLNLKAEMQLLDATANGRGMLDLLTAALP